MVPETIALAWRGREGSRKTGAEDYEKNKTQYVIQRAAPCLSVASTMAMLLAAVCLVGSSFLPPFWICIPCITALSLGSRPRPERLRISYRCRLLQMQNRRARHRERGFVRQWSFSCPSECEARLASVGYQNSDTSKQNRRKSRWCHPVGNSFAELSCCEKDYLICLYLAARNCSP